MTYRGHVKGGMVVFESPIPFPDGTEVSIERVDEPKENVLDDPNNPMIQMLDLAVDMGIPDLATNIDHYLYGHPKVDDEK
jgi:hypothetical protein